MQLALSVSECLIAVAERSAFKSPDLIIPWYGALFKARTSPSLLPSGA